MRNRSATSSSRLWAVKPPSGSSRAAARRWAGAGPATFSRSWSRAWASPCRPRPPGRRRGRGSGRCGPAPRGGRPWRRLRHGLGDVGVGPCPSRSGRSRSRRASGRGRGSWRAAAGRWRRRPRPRDGGDAAGRAGCGRDGGDTGRPRGLDVVLGPDHAAEPLEQDGDHAAERQPDQRPADGHDRSRSGRRRSAGLEAGAMTAPAGASLFSSAVRWARRLTSSLRSASASCDVEQLRSAVGAHLGGGGRRAQVLDHGSGLRSRRGRSAPAFTSS